MGGGNAVAGFNYSAGSSDVTLSPQFPLLPATRYLYLVTNRVKDASTGGAVSSSVLFDALKSTLPLAGPFAALVPIRANTPATSSTTQSNNGVPTNGDRTIPKESTRDFRNALGEARGARVRRRPRFPAAKLRRRPRPLLLHGDTAWAEDHCCRQLGCRFFGFPF